MKRYSRMLAILVGLLSSVSACFGQEREWLLDAVDRDVFLIFGVAETNDVGVSFWCRIGTQNISAFTSAPANFETPSGPTPVELTVGGVAYLLDATPNTGDRQATLEAPLVPQEKIIESLKAADMFRLRIGNHTSTYPLAGADFDGLIRLCAKPVDEQP
jgi:hypothetical protein